ncbi:A24 family peptidase [Nocardia suismassiliense]|uniref:A24 family peptidase n=1 Tax=Nocardia suismassiliense TaxID=2077092 RepID=UPI000D1E5BAB|nr:A24 family peptidase [Nocardia suismassiliense]
MPNVAFAALLAWCVVLSVIDFRQRRLPNSLTGWGAVAVFGYALSTDQCTAALLGAVLLAVPYLLVHLALPAAFGAGDVKLAVGLGAAAALGGGHAWVRAAVAAPLLTACAGIAAVVLCRIRNFTDPPRRIRCSTAPFHQIRESADPSSRMSDSAGRSASSRSSPSPSGVPPCEVPVAKRRVERPSRIAIPHGPAMCIATVCALATAGGGGS